MFKPVSNKVAFPKMEEEVLAFWEKDGTFKKSLKKNEGKERYKFYDGPPFATGLPHYGHLLAGTIKDIVPRYQTMRGKYVERRFGWDTHGLPIEALAQEALGVAGAPEIKKLGVDKFNEQCRSMVLKYVGEWRKTVTRMGRWVDFDNDYKRSPSGGSSSSSGTKAASTSRTASCRIPGSFRRRFPTSRPARTTRTCRTRPSPCVPRRSPARATR